ncbi:hypothetical protein KQX54_007450 [Cotesia glomerata]|uniref:Uncharacterized protein n=1 Tax=Cotesia glomerata TaxID=32391 RepID=A0AAV7IMM9_COTGL|nr:hypothetical protein KQX54_007450 [Cotesia glomerata]
MRLKAILKRSLNLNRRYDPLCQENWGSVAINQDEDPTLLENPPWLHSALFISPNASCTSPFRFCSPLYKFEYGDSSEAMEEIIRLD